MPTVTSALKNSTIVPIFRNLIPGLMRSWFGVASHVAPTIARRQAERLFMTPPRYAGRTGDVHDAWRTTLDCGGDRLAVWQAGAATAPAALLVHGWGGRGAQLDSFVAPLRAAGFRVVWFDQPGHGDSGRRRVGLPDFTRAVNAVAQRHGPFTAAVGHSLGAAALGLALRGGLALERVALVSVPASMREHTHAFARFIGIAPAVREAMRRQLEARYGVRFADIDRIEDMARVKVPALFVHDAADAQIPFRHAITLSARMPNARLVRTHGLGHTRILREPAVVQAVARFLAGDDDVPDELPALPRPAPLY
jgi:pimeloyl-ACP methyl ester carboxylesterase